MAIVNGKSLENKGKEQRLEEQIRDIQTQLLLVVIFLLFIYLFILSF